MEGREIHNIDDVDVLVYSPAKTVGEKGPQSLPWTITGRRNEKNTLTGRLTE